MADYPKEITPEILAKNADIPTDDIRHDLDDTQYELKGFIASAKAYRDLAENGPLHERRMNAFRADAYDDRVKDCQALADYLTILLAARVAAEQEQAQCQQST